MAQVGWVFLDSQGGRHRVGVYHGDQSGHLLIHCNLKVVQVDFSVKEPKTYAFFINDEFCEVRITKEKDRFFYEFYVDKKVDTPLNRERKRLARRDQKHVWIFATGFVLLVLVAAFFVRRFDYNQKNAARTELSHASQLDAESFSRLLREGKTSEAVLQILSHNGTQKIDYQFKTLNDSVFSGEWHYPKEGIILLPTGLPLRSGDSFEATYVPSNPAIHQVHFDRPGRTAVEHYIELAMETESKAHPEYSREKCNCRVLVASEIKGRQALATIIYQTQTYDQNPLYNSDGYQRLFRDPETARAVETKCWDK